VLLWLGVVGQLVFVAVRCAPLWTGTQPLEATTPALYLPFVAANFISAESIMRLWQSSMALHNGCPFMFLAAKRTSGGSLVTGEANGFAWNSLNRSQVLFA